MKQLITLLCATLISTFCFANPSSSNLKSLDSAWKGSHQASRPQQIQNDITMVYGGADVSHKAVSQDTFAA